MIYLWFMEQDTTVPYEISNKYMKLFHKGTKFVSIEDGNHNFDKLSDIKQVLKLTLEFFWIMCLAHYFFINKFVVI